MPRVTEAHKEAMRDRLVDAAIELLRERGVAQTTTRGILERAGLSAGALYHYFSGKGELFATVAERIYAQNLASMVPGEDGPFDREGLVGLLESLLRPDNSASLLPDLRPLAASDPEIAEALRSFDALLVSAMADMVDSAKATGAVVEGADGEALVETVLIFFEALRSRQGSGGFVTSHERVAAAFLALAAGGVLAPQTGRSRAAD